MVSVSKKEEDLNPNDERLESVKYSEKCVDSLQTLPENRLKKHHIYKGKQNGFKKTSY